MWGDTNMRETMVITVPHLSGMLLCIRVHVFLCVVISFIAAIKHNREGKVGSIFLMTDTQKSV